MGVRLLYIYKYSETTRRAYTTISRRVGRVRMCMCTKVIIHITTGVSTKIMDKNSKWNSLQKASILFIPIYVYTQHVRAALHVLRTADCITLSCV